MTEQLTRRGRRAPFLFALTLVRGLLSVWERHKCGWLLRKQALGAQRKSLAAGCQNLSDQRLHVRVIQSGMDARVTSCVHPRAWRDQGGVGGHCARWYGAATCRQSIRKEYDPRRPLVGARADILRVPVVSPCAAPTAGSFGICPRELSPSAVRSSSCKAFSDPYAGRRDEAEQRRVHDRPLRAYRLERRRGAE
jgi:hypothetical protein